MEQYGRISKDLSRVLTAAYSTSFGTSSTLLDRRIRPDIYAIYGLVRIADELVDTFEGPSRERMLDELEKEVYDTLKQGFSVNPLVHAFGDTANRYGITKELIAPFFASMRTDLHKTHYSVEAYNAYIYGSAEVVGLMCLHVFCEGDDSRYRQLAPAARALGAAYQKINFLRDFADDFERRGRLYFPHVTYDGFTESDKAAVIASITSDLAIALPAISLLPASCRRAVRLSASYYTRLLHMLERAPVERIKRQRIRVATLMKVGLLAQVLLSFGGSS